MALKFEKHKETIYTFPGRDLRIERMNQGISREAFAEQMEEITGISWYPSKVSRFEKMLLNYVYEETMEAIQKALQVK